MKYLFTAIVLLIISTPVFARPRCASCCGAGGCGVASPGQAKPDQVKPDQTKADKPKAKIAPKAKTAPVVEKIEKTKKKFNISVRILQKK